MSDFSPTSLEFEVFADRLKLVRTVLRTNDLAWHTTIHTDAFPLETVKESRKIWYFHFDLQLVSIVLNSTFLKLIYSEKATKFCEIFTLLLFYVVPVKSKVKISQNFVAFSEYMNFKGQLISKANSKLFMARLKVKIENR